MPVQKPLSLEDLADFYALFSRGDVRLYEEGITVKCPPSIKLTRTEFEASIAKTPPGGWERIVMRGRGGALT